MGNAQNILREKSYYSTQYGVIQVIVKNINE